VLLEKPGRRPGQLVGRSPYLQPVQIMAPVSLIGSVVPVTVTEIGSNSLFGALAAPRTEAGDGRVPRSDSSLVGRSGDMMVAGA
jgi:tRNA-2-methylthio-N6-dimethylallyladenosine synthase